MIQLKKASLLFALALGTSAFAQQYSTKFDEKTELFGVVDANDKYIVQPIYKYIDFEFGEHKGIFQVMDKNDKIGFINETGKLVVPCKYYLFEGFENGYSIVAISVTETESKWGLMDSTGKETIALVYDYLDYFPAFKVVSYTDKESFKAGLMDVNGKTIITPQYDALSMGVGAGLWSVSKDYKFGAVNLKNQVIIPFKFNFIGTFSDDIKMAVAIGDVEGKYGVIDATGKTVIPYEYEDAYISSRFILASKGGKWGVLSKSGAVVIPFEYKSISSVIDNSCYVYKTDTDEGVKIDLSGK